MRSGEDYVESLDEGRTVFVNGDESENVAKHPAFTGVVKTLAIIGIAARSRR